MAWVVLIFAGLLEIGWAIGLKYTEGFTRWGPSLLTIAVATVSFLLLGLAVRDLPVGTAYAVWMSIGVAGTATLGIVLFNEPANAARLLCFGLILTGVIGLKLLEARG